MTQPVFTHESVPFTRDPISEKLAEVIAELTRLSDIGIDIAAILPAAVIFTHRAFGDVIASEDDHDEQRILIQAEMATYVQAISLLADLMKELQTHL